MRILILVLLTLLAGCASAPYYENEDGTRMTLEERNALRYSVVCGDGAVNAVGRAARAVVGLPFSPCPVVKAVNDAVTDEE